MHLQPGWLGGRLRRGGFFVLYNAVLSHKPKQVKRYWKGILLIKAGVDYKCCGEQIA